MGAKNHMLYSNSFCRGLQAQFLQIDMVVQFRVQAAPNNFESSQAHKESIGIIRLVAHTHLRRVDYVT